MSNFNVLLQTDGRIQNLCTFAFRKLYFTTFSIMEYNTKRNKLIIREYGRNIQKMVEHCSMIEDRKKRTETAYSIVRVMGDIINSKDQSDAKNRSNDDFWHKLWDHLHIMSDYSLDVDSPFPKPEKDFSMKNVEKPSYNTRNNIRFRTYGINMQHLIEKVSSYPEKVRKEYAPILANHLKMMYLSYNRNSVNDILIRHQISELSDGRIEIPEDFDFTTTKELLNTASQNSAPQPAPGKKKKKKKKKKAAAV